MSYKKIAEKSAPKDKENNILVSGLRKLKDKKVELCQYNNETREGNILAVDNRLNIFRKQKKGIKLIRGIQSYVLSFQNKYISLFGISLFQFFMWILQFKLIRCRGFILHRSLENL